MLILSSAQIRQWDLATVQQLNITSLELMERAAAACAQWLLMNQLSSKPLFIFCGKGNNGGDGLALARLLSAQGSAVNIFILETGKPGTDDFQSNLNSLHLLKIPVQYIQNEGQIPQLESSAIVIDALFGTGLQRSAEGLPAAIIEQINRSGATVVSIDMPSGMAADCASSNWPRIAAKHTLSFQSWKLAFLIPENEPFTGKVEILDIGLVPEYLRELRDQDLFVTTELATQLYQPRKPYSHKGHHGHALLIAGSRGMMGAALLGAEACLRSGVGKLTCKIPGCGYEIMQTVVPEAMTRAGSEPDFITPFEIEDGYAAVGIGPGLGNHKTHTQLLASLFSDFRKPCVVDADALNTIAANSELLKLLPPFSILTPHPTEFDRIFGKSTNGFARMEAAQRAAAKHQCIVVLKGHYTLVAMPGGQRYFNSTGNAGLAKGGSGDVLTGILLGLLAQGYAPEAAALFGVYLHGLAADIMATELGMEAMLARDVVRALGRAFGKLRN